MIDQTILVIEDSEAQREALLLSLEMRGFSVASAGTVQEARERFSELDGQIALMVIDMRLEDSSAPGITGADLAVEFCNTHPRRRPEFLILSAYSPVDYYKLAIELGVAAYLSKEVTNNKTLVRHIRSLLIRRNLSAENDSVSRRISTIAETSRWLSETSVRFCQEIVAPVLSAFLGAPFIIIINDGRQVQACIGESELLRCSNELYEQLDRLIHHNANSDSPYVLQTAAFRSPSVMVDKDLVARLDGAVFVPLAISNNLRLSLGILKSNQDLAEDPKPLAEVLGHYLQRAVLDPLICALKYHVELKAKREAELVAQSCVVIGQEQQAILSQALELEAVDPSSYFFRRMIASSEDLRDTGQILLMLERKNPAITRESLRMTEVIQIAREELEELLPEDKLSVTGDCIVSGFKEELVIATSRILHFFSRRMRETDHDVSLWISVKCAQTEEGSTVTFEDYSRRLPEQLRQRLFSPFAQGPLFSSNFDQPEERGLHLPLYLAKSLLELKHGGSLEDCSSELPGELGHRFVVTFPRL
ncbi:MAG TPA: response regulator [Blastocatellia bacterium]|nr:response regulator [Blastocatellia bacterium]